MNRWQNIAFLDDDENIKVLIGIEVICKSADAFKYMQDLDIFVNFGIDAIEEIIRERLQYDGKSIPVLVHPDAFIGVHVKLGASTLVIGRAIVNRSTKLGEGSIIYIGATIDHDNLIKDYVHISSGVHTVGSVRIGKGTRLGIEITARLIKMMR